ncbi:penicillin acylase family protein [Actinotalea sp. K2]|uniref:penicillin acylase family protein n=1 Tax=Actinotalea sp. K2 TaxID=2939438 RepID=UPI00201767A0|nr:penicillin acylase family protein [Actinotalea sp. K2]MCL3861254.1 penicillin acylase family protein [Actinotalea sp. K2]
MPRRRVLRFSVIGVAAVLVLVLVAGVALVATMIRRPLPSHAGGVTVAGLEGEVTVLRDARGVPSIYADTATDLFHAQGFVHAQDRFFEMDYRRHVTAGRLSELVGQNADALSADRVIRTFGWRLVAEQEWDLLEPSTQEYLEAYAAGVNAYLEGRSTDALGVEYTILGLQVEVRDPEPWDPIDSLAWLKAMAWDLKGNYDDELARAMTYTTVRDVGLVNDLFPRYPQEENAPILQSVTPAEPVARTLGVQGTDAATIPAETLDGVLAGAGVQEALTSAHLALSAVPHLVGEGDGIGSNSWVVAGEHTASGAPLLANDPHLSISAPGIWAQQGLYCRDVSPQCPFEVSGFTFSGFPGVIIGHNADLAWGLTNLGADVTDFFLERTDGDTYLRDAEQVPLEIRTEVIEVNGGEPVELEIRSTVHGPIVSGVLDIGRIAGAPTADGRRAPSTEVSLAWTALEPGRTADAVFLLAAAKDAADVAAAAALFAVPSQNIVFATVAGDIGYQAPGLIPVRQRIVGDPVPSDGTWPRPGWDSRYDWQGYVEPEQMPAGLNPAEGFIVAANQAVTPSGVGPFLTSDWDYGYRAQRIRDQLEQHIQDGTPVTVEMTNALQNDAWNPFAELLVPVLLAAPIEDDFTEGGVALLRDWDYVQGTDSSAAAYFAAVWSTLLDITFHDDLPQDQWPSGGSRWLEVVSELIEQPDSPWWDDRRTVNVVENRDEILRRAMSTARLELTERLGKEPTDWQWGRVHTAAPEHPVLGGEGLPGPVRQLVNPGPLAVPGGSSIVNATAWDASTGSFAVTAAPSMRMVVDLGDLDASTWVTLTGTSGHPGSVHYTDQFGAWADGETFPWPFGQEAVADAAVREITLRPGS